MKNGRAENVYSKNHQDLESSIKHTCESMTSAKISILSGRPLHFGFLICFPE